jgi:hypothetical protein
VANARVLNQADFVIGRQLPGNYSAELGYQNAWNNYLNDGNGYTIWSDVGNTIKPTLLYELSGKTKLLVQYNIGYIHYYNQPSLISADYTVQQAMAGFRWAATSRLSGELKGGYAWRQFVNDVDLLGISYQNTSAPIYSVNLHYLVSPKTDLDFNIYREFDIGGDLNPITGTLNLIQGSYTRNAVGFTLTTRTRPDLTFNLAGSCYLDQYDDTILYQGRLDRYYNAGINFIHKFRRYLSWGLGYNFQKRDTQAVGLSYTENAVTISVGLSY